ncbi:MAG: terpene cyclase/mutase family protein [Gemmatales bacterium]|nr:terpene cyclase/mutase family protein [Gemmatales bacterium]MDW8387794.1 terpene cyclase/mutase family protein [Gemmatales bacterium]
MRRVLLIGVAVASLWFGQLAIGQVGPDPDQYNQMLDRAIAFLRKQQAEDGSFSKERSLGITGVVVTGLLQTGRVDRSDPMVANGLKFIESLVNQKEGHIAGQNPRDQLKNYVTSVNVMAFATADRHGKYKRIVDDAVHFLTELQWDDGEGKTRADNFYGGAGYDSKSRPDLSNTQFFVDALKAAGLPKDDPAFQRAVVFISRCQNLKGEFNDQPWADKINDGSFIYSPAGPGETKADPLPNGGLPGYGSMTYAGVKSLIYAGVDKNDKRVQAALQWLRKNYTVERNPGMPRGRDQQGLYYYYHTMAKCLDALGDDYFVDADGVKHDWRKDIAEALAKRQRSDGSWINELDRWFEGDPNLVTGYALMTLSYCKPKK